jgi:hypothetical protein
MRLSIVSLTKGMEFVGDVVSKRQHYFVLRATSVYYVLSMSNTKVNSGNFNLVSKRAVDYLLKRLAGRKGVTAKSVHARTKRPRLLTTHLQVLNALYVMAAMGRAHIDRRVKGKALYFNVR